MLSLSMGFREKQKARRVNTFPMYSTLDRSDYIIKDQNVISEDQMPVFKLLLLKHAQFWLPAVQDKMSYQNLPFLPLNPFDVKKITC